MMELYLMSARLLLIFLVVVVSVLPAQRRFRRDPGRQNPFARNEQAIAEGRALYNRSCTMCHGMDATVGDRAPALAGNRRYIRNTDQEIFDSIRNGIPGTEMPPLPLPEENIWKIVAYIRSLRATAYDAAVPGDPARGEKIFWGKGECGRCHRIAGRGGILGPDLSNVGGQRTLNFIKESLTQARPHIPRGYQPVTVVTPDGSTISGVLKNEHNFSLQLLDADGDIHLFLRDELREIRYANQSLMPSDYDKRLAPAEFQDLLAFLSRQAAQRIRQEELGDQSE